MITHDLGVVAETCDKVAIMYAGEAVEYGTLADIFTGENHHPYTVGLFGSIPSLDRGEQAAAPHRGPDAGSYRNCPRAAGSLRDAVTVRRNARSRCRLSMRKTVIRSAAICSAGKKGRCGDGREAS